jgi:ATP-dependent RNA helicase SUPV3L1/SUV3
MKNISDKSVRSEGHVKAILGPTNTGKTHLAVERMLGHHTGMIGLPLRLLAREVYERIVLSRGRAVAALITGEEKIIPKGAQYFVCTVESMPTDKTVEFLAVDEIQLAADFERGHIFTDRLLRARGTHETIFLGADTVRGLISRLVPDVTFIHRERFSELSYTAPKKLARLPERTALVAFSAREVYGYAEMLRSVKGGAAVVMGALSPRTRNAQVEMYQNGDVDYLVATDAIGMGLNMDIEHVAFAATWKFDGRSMRELYPSELAQIAGRAGRHMNHGTFGCLTEGADYQTGLAPDQIQAIENHKFAPLSVFQWRNSLLDFSRSSNLIRSLEEIPNRKGLTRALESSDLSALRNLSDRRNIADRLHGPAGVKLLWEICQVPDFRSISDDEHLKILSKLFKEITSDTGVIPENWLEKEVEYLDKMDGDIDSLSSRIAHIRTWTYISHRSDWLADAKYWQSRTKEIEDKLSDALHERLTLRFVDRRTSVLMRELRQKGKLMANIDTDGSIFAGEHFIGTLEGFTFKEDSAAFGEDSKTLRTAADEILSEEISKRTEELHTAEDGELSLIFGETLTNTTLNWRGVPLAKVTKGVSLLVPKLSLIPSPLLHGDALQMVTDRLNRWLSNHIGEILAPLFALEEAVNGAKGEDGNVVIDGVARGIAFQMFEKLGTIPRRLIARDFRSVEREGRFQLKSLGIWLGSASLYIPSLLKPAPAQLRLLLWAIFNGQDKLPDLPPAGLCTIPVESNSSRVFYEISGYRVVGKNAVRLDMLERLANAARAVSMKGAFPASADLMSLVGTSGDAFTEIMSYLGYVQKEFSVEDAAKIEEKREALLSEEAAIKAAAEAKETASKTETSETKIEEVKTEEVKTEEVKTEEVKTEEVKTEEVKTEEVKTEEAPTSVMLFMHQPHEARNANRKQGGQNRRPSFNKEGRKDAKRPAGKGRSQGQNKGGKSYSSAPKKKFVVDPDSPFAALAGLKAQLKKK